MTIPETARAERRDKMASKNQFLPSSKSTDSLQKNTARRYITITTNNGAAFNSSDKVLTTQNSKRSSVKFERKTIAKYTISDTDIGLSGNGTSGYVIPSHIRELETSLNLVRTVTLPAMESARSPLCRGMTRYPTQIDFFNLEKDSKTDRHLKPLRDPFVTPPLYPPKDSELYRQKNDKEGCLLQTPEFISNNQVKLHSKGAQNKRVYVLTKDNANRYKTYVKPNLPKQLLGSNPCLFKLFGPILLSAPHGIKLWRGGTDGRKRRIHYREIWSTELVLKLSLHINKLTGVPASFIVWDRRVAFPADSRNLDPNYLTEEQFEESPWHEALVQFKRFGDLNNCPIMHIDVHGKKDRKTNMDVDFGFRALETRWSDKGFVGWVKSEVGQQFGSLFELPYCECNDMKYTCNVNPSLCGDWGGDLYTMTSQSVCMGTPAFQLEIPRSIRNHLIENESFLAKFAKCIVDVYSTCVERNKEKNSSSKENKVCSEYIEKLYNEHLKIQRITREKQI